MLGRYDNGIGKVWDDKDYMKFYNDGHVTFPYLSDGMWFMTQHKRWGLLKSHPDYLAVAKQVNRIDVYKQGAAAAGVALREDAGDRGLRRELRRQRERDGQRGAQADARDVHRGGGRRRAAA